ncbi:MAG: hypothetical protein LQ352_000973 [Teloschistes flavicans]|nr:MAG: hypothetical protein LQ352_000973 [Teloschistes flavicans]
MDGGAMETKPPLTPPADLMDIDVSLARGELSNGHHLKDSSPNTAPATGNSTQATSLDDFDSGDTNGVNATTFKANQNASNLNADLSAIREDGLPSAIEASTHFIKLPEEGAVNVTSDSSSFVLEQPTSAVREEAQVVISDQTSDTRDQEPKEKIAQDHELANGSLSDQSQTAEESVTLESHAPEPSTTDAAAISAHSEQTQEQDHATAQLPITTTDVPHHPPVPVPDGTLPEEPIDPAPSPVLSTDAPAHTLDSEPMSVDQPPSTTPQSPSKISRPREDDEDEGPVAKRSKVDDPSPNAAAPTDSEFKIPAQPGNANTTDLTIITQNLSGTAKPITAAQKKHLLKVVGNTKKSDDAKWFTAPVDPVALSIPTYPEVIKEPMDLKTIEDRLKNDAYPSLQGFKSDVDLILSNAIKFNGPEHAVAKCGRAVVEKICGKGMAHLPGPEVVASATGDKKSRKGSLPAVEKVVPSRRESRASLPAAPAPSPITAQSPTTFALNPQGIPLIRRDSTKGDGRPKREIHPPAPRDLPYANSKPKKKKYQAELKFCTHVLDELAKQKYNNFTTPFAFPVDPVALNIPDYHSVIKKPMDLRTVREKLAAGQYENAKEFEADVRLIFANCHKYNGVDHPIRNLAKTLEGIFDHEMGNKRSWIEANSPVSGAQSATSSDGEDEDDEEEEEEVEEPADDQLTKLQRSIAEMSRQVEMLKAKKSTPPAASKKGGKGGKSDRKAIKKGASTAPVKQEKKGPTKSSKKEQYVTYEQKQDISNRINSLSETKMAKALKIIRDNMPSLQGVQDDELELDIDELSDEVLRKLWEFVKKNSKTQEEVRAPPVASAAPTASKKKNKPMTKQEQERQIQDLKHISSQFQNPTPSIETAPQTHNVRHDTSGDEEDSEESEEE